jgi:predicted DNA-binding transcriptional regulator AlpA
VIDAPPSQPKRLVTFDQLESKYGIPGDRGQIDKLERLGLFPKRIRIGVRRVGWFEHEIEQMLDQRAAERDGPAADHLSIQEQHAA